MRVKQSGMTLIGFLIVVIVLGFFAYMAMKLVPSYIEFMGATKAMNQLAAEGGSDRSLETVRGDLLRKMDFQYVDDATIKASNTPATIMPMRFIFLFSSPQRPSRSRLRELSRERAGARLCGVYRSLQW